MIKVKLKGIDSTVRILNVYGPYTHRREFWEEVSRVCVGPRESPQEINARVSM